MEGNSFTPYHNALTVEEQRQIVEWLESLRRYVTCPGWLGCFEQIRLARHEVPKEHQALVDMLAAMWPAVSYNAVFLQRYRENAFVAPHHDPANNRGYTIIAIAGKFEGGVSTIDGRLTQLLSGDVLIQRCTINKARGPLHSVSPVTRGTRYALILNRIEETKP